MTFGRYLYVAASQIIDDFLSLLFVHLLKIRTSGWFYPRSEKITAKGKGELQTYWLDLSASSIDDRMSLSTSSIHSSLSLQQTNREHDRRLKRLIGGQEIALADMQICRLVDWILDTLNPMLCRIVSLFV